MPRLHFLLLLKSFRLFTIVPSLAAPRPLSTSLLPSKAPSLSTVLPPSTASLALSSPSFALSSPLFVHSFSIVSLFDETMGFEGGNALLPTYTSAYNSDLDNPSPLTAPSPPTTPSPPIAPSPPTAPSPPIAPSPPTAPSPPIAPSPPTAPSPPIVLSPHSSVHSNAQTDEQPRHISDRP
ncbi:microtubule-actin cross-linking factor 1 isoform X25 [Senna tora]|uniref:Microtubule-actin cross-linking factor 1 isoform X25 n=1 Tax=Senna tora TaxID=362788 RepID=A0A834WCF4_9FABA|nr:microtubule-actin cross-linking factor 1 isoform X25 [Senna tora]